MTRLGNARQERGICDEHGGTKRPEKAQDDRGAPGCNANQRRESEEGVAGRQGSETAESAADAAEEKRDECSREDPDGDRDPGRGGVATNSVTEEQGAKGREDREGGPYESKGEEPQS